MPTETTVPHVFTAINAVQTALAKEGITKSRKNAQQGYSFRGIDEIYNALSALLAEQSLCILPVFTERIVTERESKAGGVLFGVTVKGEFSLVSSKDGSRTTVTTYGEAMDSADKATNKAMSAAYKYACLQAFCIPTEGDNDADAQTHEVAGRRSDPARSAAPVARSASAPVGQPVPWQDCVIHFGKNKGKALGELPANTLSWYITEWQPKPYGDRGTISQADTALRNALDRAQSEVGQGKAAVQADHAEAAKKAAARRAPAPAAVAADDDMGEIPF